MIFFGNYRNFEMAKRNMKDPSHFDMKVECIVKMGATLPDNYKKKYIEHF